MTFDQVRKRTIIALFSDDQLMDQLVLKGGNALSLIHGVSSRTSPDLDFSLTGDFEDFEQAKRRIFRVLTPQGLRRLARRDGRRLLSVHAH